VTVAAEEHFVREVTEGIDETFCEIKPLEFVFYSRKYKVKYSPILMNISRSVL
jgi:hypothetical protein